MEGIAGRSNCEKEKATTRRLHIEQLLPRLSEVPTPAHLHPFVRVLGLCGDRDGLIELLEWIAYYAPEIDAAADEVMNGKRMMRSCLTAARLFLEQDLVLLESHLPDGSMAKKIVCYESDEKVMEKDCRYTQRFRRVVDENPQWGGWPTDEEIIMYVHRPWANNSI